MTKRGGAPPYDTVAAIRAWPISNGWSCAPDGRRIQLGDECQLGNRCLLGNGETTTTLCHQILAALPAVIPLVKWVTPTHMSPGWGNGAPLHYTPGAVVVCEDPDLRLIQCGRGLHVLRPGIRPEWVGLGTPEQNTTLLPLRVTVQRADVIWAGLPGDDAKWRVRRLRVEPEEEER